MCASQLPVEARRKILIVEDAQEIAELMKAHLAEIADEVITVGDGKAALSLAASMRPDLIVLDLILPGMGGLEVCRSLRASGFASPIIIVTARSSDLDRLLGLDLGADDYLVKPFSVMELAARVKANLRRAETDRGPHPGAEVKPIRVGRFTLDPASRRVLRSGEPIPLSGKEFDLFLLMARDPERVFSRSDLAEVLWGQAGEGRQYAVNSTITRLRGKIEPDPANPTVIETVSGAGYRLKRDAES